jgi:hypothetical protein
MLRNLQGGEAMTKQPRVWIEAALGLMSAVMLMITLTMPDWIERFFGLAPDGGSGSTEWQWATALALTALGLFADARRLWVHTSRSPR